MAILWVEVGQPYSKQFDLLSKQINTRYFKSFGPIKVLTVADRVFSLIFLPVSPVFSKSVISLCLSVCKAIRLNVSSEEVAVVLKDEPDSDSFLHSILTL